MKEEKRRHTDDESVFGLSAVLVVPGRAASGVDSTCAGAEQRWFRFTQRGGALPAGGPGVRQEPVQRVLSAPTAAQQAAGGSETAQQQI